MESFEESQLVSYRSIILLDLYIYFEDFVIIFFSDTTDSTSKTGTNPATCILSRDSQKSKFVGLQIKQC